MKKLPTRNYSKIGDLQSILSDKNLLVVVLHKIEKHFSIKAVKQLFGNSKRRGTAAISLFSILLVMPFIGVATIGALCKKKNKEKHNITNGKDSFYALKNNEQFSWRSLLYIIVKRFNYLINRLDLNLKESITAIIFDDTVSRKRSWKIEKVSRVWDHVEGISVLGYKILVMGFWDGSGFTPIDFSFHREKGQAYDKLKAQLKKLEKVIIKLKESEHKLVTIVEEIKKEIKGLSKEKQISKTRTKEILKLKERKGKKNEELKKNKKEIEKLRDEQKTIREELNQTPRYGLKKEELKIQNKKQREHGTSGIQREKECDSKKTDNVICMLKRAAKHGIVAAYVLTDSWFFNYNLLKAALQTGKGKTHYLGMAPMGKFLYHINGQEYKVSEIINNNKQHQRKCKKLKASYIRVQANLKDIAIHMYFVKLSKRDRWKLLVTTNLNLPFIEMMQIYQIRWSIEVFFKEAKQYLKLGKCQSDNLDAQIADATMVMIRYIMLSLHKRTNSHQSIGEIFETISIQTTELNIVQKLWSLFIELQQILGEIEEIDILGKFNSLLSNPKAKSTFEKMAKLLSDDQDSQINDKKAA